MTKLWISSLLLPLALAACGSDAEERAEDRAEDVEERAEEVEEEMDENDDEDVAPEAAAPLRAEARLQATAGNQAGGTVTFEAVEGGVRVHAELAGLEPGTTHGFHVHENGDCSAPDGTSAGGHFNPGGHDHALPEAMPRHAGDLGNVTAGADGTATLNETFTTFALEGDTSVMDRGVILHADEDDGGQPTGNAGARIACGVIRAPEA